MRCHYAATITTAICYIRFWIIVNVSKSSNINYDFHFRIYFVSKLWLHVFQHDMRAVVEHIIDRSAERTHNFCLSRRLLVFNHCFSLGPNKCILWKCANFLKRWKYIFFWLKTIIASNKAATFSDGFHKLHTSIVECDLYS